MSIGPTPFPRPSCAIYRCPKSCKRSRHDGLGWSISPFSREIDGQRRSGQRQHLGGAVSEDLLGDGDEEVEIEQLAGAAVASADLLAKLAVAEADEPLRGLIFGR